MTNKTMQELNKIEEELQAILTKGQQKEQEYMAEIETAEQNEEEAKRAVIVAKQDGTATEYAKANQDLRTAKDIAQFYSGKIEKLKDDPYITEAEYNKYSEQIKSSLDKVRDIKLRRAGELLKELSEIREDFLPMLEKGNSLLGTLQHDLLKDEGKILYKGAAPIYGFDQIDRYKGAEGFSWIKGILAQYGASDLLKLTEKGENK